MNPFSSYSTEEMNAVLRMEREVGATFERERCAKIAEFFESNADEFRRDNPGWSGFTEACELIAGKIRSGE